MSDIKRLLDDARKHPAYEQEGKELAASELAAPHCSEKWLVRDLTGAEPSVSCDTKADAEAWVRHLWEWCPNARPVIEDEISRDGSSKTKDV